jgi:hypothetical protein
MTLYSYTFPIRMTKRCADCGAGIRSRRTYCIPCKAVRRKATHKRHNAKRRGHIAEYKTLVGCRRCGYNEHAAALELHHRDPATKSQDFKVSVQTGKITRAEVELCDVLCANCHRIEHHG